MAITEFYYGNISNNGGSELPILTVTYDGERVANYTMSFVIANSNVDGFTVDSNTGNVSYDKSNTGEMPIDLGTI
ncbi:MAG: hypothetical protein LUC37_01995 [Prevotella sp.]|nr:hypothetical protein [Prevotella sp.]